MAEIKSHGGDHVHPPQPYNDREIQINFHILQQPSRADNLQGQRGVSLVVLAANDRGIGSGWQQSKQNSPLSAVVGH